MSIEFIVEHNPRKDLYAEMMASAPTNPFYTHSYIEAKRSLGFEPCVCILREGSEVESACTAFMKSGYLSRSLEITSLPLILHREEFWKNLLQFCAREKVSRLEINSYASTESIVPTMPGQINRRTRFEHVLDLKTHDLWARLSTNHKRNIRRAHKARLEMKSVIAGDACYQHSRLVRLSMGRRKRRGEPVSDGVDLCSFVSLTKTGAGKLFQAFQDDRVVSSSLVLIADRGGYYQSAGTDSEGMACGASHFLVYEIAKTLQAGSKELFNLGGVDQFDTGLERFKAGFGGSQVKLESAQFFLGSEVKKKLIAAAEWLRSKLLQ